MNIGAFKGIKPAQAFQVLDPNQESLADGIGSSYGIIGYKGKVWSLRLRGETYYFNRPEADGSMSPSPFLDVIILRSPAYKSKSFYPANTFQDGALGVRPTCAALNGVTPDADILTPQSNACATCPRNIFKMTPDGHKSRDCRDYKRLAVLILPSQSKQLLGAPLMEPVFLRVPAASLNDLAMLGEGMQAQGFHFSAFITRIGFNPQKPHPQMTFRAMTALTDKEGPIVLPLREDPVSLRITGESESGKAAPATNVVQLQQTIAPQPNAAANAAAAAQAAKAAAAAKAKAAADAANAAAQEAARLAAEADAAANAPVEDTGFGDLTATVTDNGFGDVSGAPMDAPAPIIAAPVDVAADTGAPTESDDALDAKVLALLPK